MREGRAGGARRAFMSIESVRYAAFCCSLAAIASFWPQNSTSISYVVSACFASCCVAPCFTLVRSKAKRPLCTNWMRCLYRHVDTSELSWKPIRSSVSLATAKRTSYPLVPHSQLNCS